MKQDGQQKEESGRGAETSEEEMVEEELQLEEGLDRRDNEEYLLIPDPGEKEGNNLTDNITNRLLEETEEDKKKKEEVT